MFSSGTRYVRSGPDMSGQRPDMSSQDRPTKQNVNKTCFPPRILIELGAKTHWHLRNNIFKGEYKH
jgi:hypothetical protein